MKLYSKEEINFEAQRLVEDRLQQYQDKSQDHSSSTQKPRSVVLRTKLQQNIKNRKVNEVTNPVSTLTMANQENVTTSKSLSKAQDDLIHINKINEGQVKLPSVQDVSEKSITETQSTPDTHLSVPVSTVRTIPSLKKNQIPPHLVDHLLAQDENIQDVVRSFWQQVRADRRNGNSEVTIEAPSNFMKMDESTATSSKVDDDLNADNLEVRKIDDNEISKETEHIS